MSRKRTGERIQWRPRLKSWVGRVREEDGTRSPYLELGPEESLAQQRYDRWLETGKRPAQKSRETFGAAAKRIVDEQEALGQKGAKDRRARLRNYAATLDRIEVGDIEGCNIASVIDEAVNAGLSGGAALKLRTDISRVLTRLVREGAIRHNVARGVELPENAVVDNRRRLELTDEEYLRFQRRGYDNELNMMALHARELGGHRTSDLHAEDWKDWDTVSWKTVHVRRPKTDGRRAKERGGKQRASRAYELVKIAIPPEVLGPTKAWWRAQGSPTSGPVFPLRKGPRAGQRKVGKGISYVKPLRRALWEEGIVRPLPGFETATGDDRKKFCALQVDTDDTRPVDFHSFRRAFGTALAKQNVNIQTSMDAMGHSTESAHHRYRGERTIELPPMVDRGERNGSLESSAPPAPPAPAAPALDLAAVVAAVTATLQQLNVVPQAPMPPLAPIDPRHGSKDVSN